MRLRVAEALEHVGLAPAEQFMDKYPSDLSGGQKQRAVIARAIILNPVLLVADEPVSMLDMSVRAKILDLMLALKRDFDLTYLYITHDLATAKFFCDRIAIMYLGRIVEIGPSEAIYEDPKHPYTQALLRAIPEPDPRRSVPRDLPRGEVPDAARPPLGCSFHPRCPKRVRDLRLGDARPAATCSRRAGRGWGRPSTRPSGRCSATWSRSREPATRVRLPARGGARADDLLRVLEQIRADDPDEPFWKGVRHMHAEGDAVEIEWNEPREPKLVPAGRVQVECHLYG